MKYSVSWLQLQIEKGLQPNYLFYWGHIQIQQHIIDKSCFSQWFPSAFFVDGIRYATAEHWMMAKKALLFDDEVLFEKILVTEHPAIIKKLGREVKNFEASVWTKWLIQLWWKETNTSFFKTNH